MNLTKKNARFVTFEGGEGTGKSTQALLITDYLRLKGDEVVLTREPGGTDGAELIRALLVSGDINRWDPITEALLMITARIDHWKKVIKPALDAGKWVICDRFSDSTIAYQGYGRGVDINFLKNIHRDILAESTPHRTYIFDLNPEIGLKRALARHTGEVRFENMDIAFHERMRQGYLTIQRENPDRCSLIDASQEVSTIHNLIRKDLEDHDACRNSLRDCG